MSKKKIIIVGASHGGHQSIIELLNRYDDVDITLFEAGDFISFMSCGMELFLEDSVTNVNDVRNFSEKSFPQENVHIMNNHLVQKSTLTTRLYLFWIQQLMNLRIMNMTN